MISALAEYAFLLLCCLATGVYCHAAGSVGSQQGPAVCCSGRGVSLTRGKVLCRTLPGSTGRSYLLYQATKHAGRDRPLILVHGQSRGAAVLVEVFRPFAEQYGTTLIAPVFDKETSAGYQRLGLMSRRKDRSRPEVWLRRILDDVNRLTDISTKRFRLFGHSGGAQFAHRYAMAYPDTVKRYAISAAGWYTFPDPSVDFPYGMKADPRLPNFVPNIEKFLAVPTCVLVGADDTARNATLNTSERLDRTQGRTRLERAQRWVAAMTAAARERRLEPLVQLHILPDAGHRLAELATHGRLGHIASRHLFEKPGPSG